MPQERVPVKRSYVRPLTIAALSVCGVGTIAAIAGGGQSGSSDPAQAVAHPNAAPPADRRAEQHVEIVKTPTQHELPNANVSLWTQAKSHHGQTVLELGVHSLGRHTTTLQLEVREADPNMVLRPVTPSIRTIPHSVVAPEITESGRVAFEIPASTASTVDLNVPRLGDPRAGYPLNGDIRAYADGHRVDVRHYPGHGANSPFMAKVGWDTLGY